MVAPLSKTGFTVHLLASNALKSEASLLRVNRARLLPQLLSGNPSEWMPRTVLVQMVWIRTFQPPLQPPPISEGPSLPIKCCLRTTSLKRHFEEQFASRVYI